MRVCYDRRCPFFLIVANSLVLTYTVNATMTSLLHDDLLARLHLLGKVWLQP